MENNVNYFLPTHSSLIYSIEEGEALSASHNNNEGDDNVELSLIFNFIKRKQTFYGRRRLLIESSAKIKREIRVTDNRIKSILSSSSSLHLIVN
jgi:hypothetical protein